MTEQKRHARLRGKPRLTEKKNVKREGEWWRRHTPKARPVKSGGKEKRKAVFGKPLKRPSVPPLQKNQNMKELNHQKTQGRGVGPM